MQEKNSGKNYKCQCIILRSVSRKINVIKPFYLHNGCYHNSFTSLGNYCHCAVQGHTGNPSFMDVRLRKAK